MDRFVSDIRIAARSLRRTPAFTAVVILTLALGIGANTAIFSVVNGVLLRPFSFQDPDRIAVLWETMPQGQDAFMFASAPNYVDWRDRSGSFEDMAAFAPREFFLTGADETLRLWGAEVTASLFEVLGAQPVVGRTFAPEDDLPGAPPVAILGAGLWRTRFGADRNVIGQSIRLGDGVFTVVGVMGDDFDFPPPIDLEGNTVPQRNELWVPFGFDLHSANRAAHFLRVIGRLAPGATIETAGADLQSIATTLSAEYPDTNDGWGIRALPFERVVLGQTRTALLVLLGAVGLVLLIACVNIANLMLVRAAARRREYAVRSALGAGRTRLILHAITESQLLALAGGAVGLGLALFGLDALVSVAPASVPRLGEVGIDGTVIGFTLLVALVTGLLFGLTPALRALSGDLVQWLRDGTRAIGGQGRGRLSASLVVVEVALSLVLLVAAGLLFRSFLTLRGIDPGFRADDVATMRMTLPASYEDPAARVGVYRLIEERVSALPGVQAAGLTLDVPLAEDHQGTQLVIEGDPEPAPGTNVTHFTAVTPGYFEALDVPLIAGRSFDGRDSEGGAPVVVINQTAAALYFRDRDPLGMRIVNDQPRTIVGVVGSLRLEEIGADPTPAMYLPYQQLGEWRDMSLIARTSTDPSALLGAVRAVVRDVDPAIPVYDLATMDDILANTIAQPRFSSLLLLAFSLLALVLAAVGIYGVISYSVSQRSREIGIRLALGARPTDALRQIVEEGLKLVGLGLAIGLIVSFVTARVIASLLYDVSPTDPATLTVVSAVLLAVGLFACLIPAARAARVQPVEALKVD